MSLALSDLPVRKVIRALESVGFTHVRTKGSHAVYRDPHGRVAIIPQHGTVKRGTLASILRQAGLAPDELLNSSTEPAAQKRQGGGAQRRACRPQEPPLS